MDGVLLVQLNTVPATEPVKFPGKVEPLLHTTWSAGCVTFGVGLTITVAVIAGPTQVPDVGVMVKVTVTGALVVLVRVPLIFPEPLAAIPVTETVLSLVQLYTVPATAPLFTNVVIAEPEQIVCADGVAIAVGVGLTV